MAEAPVSSSDLLGTVFADGQANGSITAEDMRDLIVSLMPAHGSASLASNATATTISVATTYYAISGTFVVGGSPASVTESAAGGKMTYTGTIDRHFHIVANMDMTCASNSQILAFQWHLNGSPISCGVNRKVGTGADVGAASVHADAMLSENDELELRVTNLTSTASVTVQNCYVFVLGMLV